MLKTIRQIIKNRQQKVISFKKERILNALTKFYKDLSTNRKELVTIPAFVLANQVMKEKVKTDADVNQVYKNLLRFEKQSKKIFKFQKKLVKKGA